MFLNYKTPLQFYKDNNTNEKLVFHADSLFNVYFKKD